MLKKRAQKIIDLVVPNPKYLIKVPRDTKIVDTGGSLEKGKHSVL